MSRYHHVGFTLIELLITVIIVTISATLVGPSLVNLINEQKKENAREELMTALSLTRSSAITASSWATICRSNKETTQCSQSDDNWNQGWLIFIDKNHDGLINGDETIISNKALVANNLTISTTQDRITFDSQGLAEGYKTTFLFCTNTVSHDDIVAINVSNFGRFRKATADDQLKNCYE